MEKFADYNKVFEIDINAILTNSINSQAIEEAIVINKQQLWDGKSINDEDLRPYYTEDPYFKSRESAERYKNWKKRITPNPDRYEDAPNLFINGRFYSEITINKDFEGFEFDASGSLASDIKSKYPLALGLTQSHGEDWYIKYVEEIFIDNIRDSLGL